MLFSPDNIARVTEAGRGQFLLINPKQSGEIIG